MSRDMFAKNKFPMYGLYQNENVFGRVKFTLDCAMSWAPLTTRMEGPYNNMA